MEDSIVCRSCGTRTPVGRISELEVARKNDTELLREARQLLQYQIEHSHKAGVVEREEFLRPAAQLVQVIEKRLDDASPVIGLPL